jgi:hypothetical protein
MVQAGWITTKQTQQFSIRYFGRQKSTFLAHDNRFRDTPVFAEMALMWALGLSIHKPS